MTYHRYAPKTYVRFTRKTRIIREKRELYANCTRTINEIILSELREPHNPGHQNERFPLFPLFPLFERNGFAFFQLLTSVKAKKFEFRSKEALFMEVGWGGSCCPPATPSPARLTTVTPDPRDPSRPPAVTIQSRAAPHHPLQRPSTALIQHRHHPRISLISPHHPLIGHLSDLPPPPQEACVCFYLCYSCARLFIPFSSRAHFPFYPLYISQLSSHPAFCAISFTNLPITHYQLITKSAEQSSGATAR